MIDINKEDKSCFFCGEICVQNVGNLDKKSISAWIDKHGSFKRFAGKIGKVYVCEDCANDLYGLVQND